MALYEDRRGTLRVGTDGGGLNRYDRDTDSFVSYRYSADDPRSLSSDHAWTITEGPDGDLWIGTQGGGLNRWALPDLRRDRPVFERFLKKDGLLSSTVSRQVAFSSMVSTSMRGIMISRAAVSPKVNNEYCIGRAISIEFQASRNCCSGSNSSKSMQPTLRETRNRDTYISMIACRTDVGNH